ncbi:hypothetical protein Bhyg_03851 [Pseudolycoriella hygida]|uniref:Protein sleepless n=1 Tax=Pseudolycoriella hygida TaxID=35572 RepID=A0A9Q0NFC2_9DIPT|nr:hypothetical protein Bhyg_03851 [Pseudolycoriella hygida]
MNYLLIFATLVVLMTNTDAETILPSEFPYLTMPSNNATIRQAARIYCYGCSSLEDSRCLNGNTLTDEHKGYCVSPFDKCGKVTGSLQGTNVVIRACASSSDCGQIGNIAPQLKCFTCSTNYCNSSVKLNSTYLFIVLTSGLAFLKNLV